MSMYGLLNSAGDDAIRVNFGGEYITDYEIGQELYRDIQKAVLGLAAILLFSWWHTKTLFISMVGIVEVVISFPGECWPDVPGLRLVLTKCAAFRPFVFCHPFFLDALLWPHFVLVPIVWDACSHGPWVVPAAWLCYLALPCHGVWHKHSNLWCLSFCSVCVHWYEASWPGQTDHSR